MPTFASDSFGSANGTELSAHNAKWKKVSGFSANAQIAGGRARASSTSSAMYYYDAAPGSADYSVSADYSRISTLVSAVALTLRNSTTAANCYRLYPDPASGAAVVGKFVAGAYTELGSISSVIAGNETANLRLEAIGATLKVYKNGSSTALATYADSSVTSAGYAGVRSFSSVAPSDSDGLHIDNFLAATPDPVVSAINSILASNITQTGARITLGLTR